VISDSAHSQPELPYNEIAWGKRKNSSTAKARRQVRKDEKAIEQNF
jgi:hypothetical protein